MFGQKKPTPAQPETALDLLQAIPAASLKTAAARRFLAFCQQDFLTQSQQENFNPQVYVDAVRLVLDRLEATRHME